MERFRYVVCAIEEAKDIKDPSVERSSKVLCWFTSGTFISMFKKSMLWKLKVKEDSKEKKISKERRKIRRNWLRWNVISVTSWDSFKYEYPGWDKTASLCCIMCLLWQKGDHEYVGLVSKDFMKNLKTYFSVASMEKAKEMCIPDLLRSLRR